MAGACTYLDDEERNYMIKSTIDKCVIFQRLFYILLLACLTSVYGKIVGAGWPLVAIIFSGCVGLCMTLFLKEMYSKRTSKDSVRFPKSQSESFDWSMHYFRAFAIMCIVLVHYFNKMGYRSFSAAWLDTSTIFFLFISGYLCQYLDMRKKTSAGIYYKKKLLNVVCPYLFCSLITIGFVLIGNVARIYVCDPNEMTLLGVVKTLLLGRAQVQYWYIPFVVFLFLLSPLVLRLRNEHLNYLLVVSVIVAVIFPTRGHLFSLKWPNFFYLYSYFTCYYLLGFVYARQREVVDIWLGRHIWIFVATAIVISIWLVHPEMLGLRMVDSCLARGVQKLAMIGIVLVLLKKFSDKKLAILDVMAKSSFTYFFVHSFFIQDFVNLKNVARGGVFVDIMLVTGYISLLVAIGSLLRKAFGRYSRYFIGS